MHVAGQSLVAFIFLTIASAVVVPSAAGGVSAVDDTKGPHAPDTANDPSHFPNFHSHPLARNEYSQAWSFLPWNRRDAGNEGVAKVGWSWLPPIDRRDYSQAWDLLPWSRRDIADDPSHVPNFHDHPLARDVYSQAWSFLPWDRRDIADDPSHVPTFHDHPLARDVYSQAWSFLPWDRRDTANDPSHFRNYSPLGDLPKSGPYARAITEGGEKNMIHPWSGIPIGRPLPF